MAAICNLTASCFLTQHNRSLAIICEWPSEPDNVFSYLLCHSGCRWTASSLVHCLHFPCHPHWRSSCPLQRQKTGCMTSTLTIRKQDHCSTPKIKQVSHTHPKPNSIIQERSKATHQRTPLREWDRDGVLTGAVADRVLALREDGWRRCWR